MGKSAKVKSHHLFLAGLALSSLLLPGCAPTGPIVPQTITINTIPPGADISVGGNYIGASPVTIAMPAVTEEEQFVIRVVVGKAHQPIQIQAQLQGYETKDVAYGWYHAPKSQIIQPVFSYSAVTKTTPGYYTFGNQITIKLSPK